MRFPYAVKYNGVIYPKDTEIEEIKPIPLVEVKPDDEVKPDAPKVSKKRATKGDK